MDIRQALAEAAALFRESGLDEPRLDAEVLLAHCLRVDRAGLSARPEAEASEAEAARFREFCRRRTEGEPVAWLTGRKEFFSLEFRLRPGVFVPRPETEGLVERAVRALRGARGGRLADACTGCGCVAIAAALHAPGARSLGTDVSERALSLARWNAARLGAPAEFRRGDLLAPLLGGPWKGATDVVCANPPYVRRGDISSLPRDVRREPRAALDGGEDGLDLVRRLGAQAFALLRPGGSLFFEIGEGQAEEAVRAARAAGFPEARAEADLSGAPRYLAARK
jgi:release factor glutamine methyltransferase